MVDFHQLLKNRGRKKRTASETDHLSFPRKDGRLQIKMVAKLGKELRTKSRNLEDGRPKVRDGRLAKKDGRFKLL